MSVHIYFIIVNLKSEFLEIGCGNLKEVVTVTVPVQIEGL
jgi:hypothetical protein